MHRRLISVEWKGEVGMVTTDLLARYLPAPYREAEYFICGPPAMMMAVEQELHSFDIPWAQMHSERFDLV